MDILLALGIRPTQLAIQIVGFLILFFVLKKFLWKPILGLMELREKEVRDMYDKADRAERDSAALKAKYETSLRRIEAEAQDKLAEAVKRGNVMAEDIVSSARKEAAIETEKARNAIREEAVRARMALRDYAVGLSFDLAGKILEKEVSQKSHEDLVAVFIKDLDSLEPEKN
jgi:F-type H+-transporting ATPase subunit b